MAEKLVRFWEYCSKCEYLKVSETEDPCNECLTHASNFDSEQPVNYKEKEK